MNMDIDRMINDIAWAMKFNAPFSRSTDWGASSPENQRREDTFALERLKNEGPLNVQKQADIGQMARTQLTEQGNTQRQAMMEGGQTGRQGMVNRGQLENTALGMFLGGGKGAMTEKEAHELALKEAQAMADPNGRIPNPHYMDEAGNKIPEQPQFFTITDYVNARKPKLMGNENQTTPNPAVMRSYLDTFTGQSQQATSNPIQRSMRPDGTRYFSNTGSIPQPSPVQSGISGARNMLATPPEIQPLEIVKPSRIPEEYGIIREKTRPVRSWISNWLGRTGQNITPGQY